MSGEGGDVDECEYEGVGEGVAVENEGDACDSVKLRLASLNAGAEGDHV